MLNYQRVFVGTSKLIPDGICSNRSFWVDTWFLLIETSCNPSFRYPLVNSPYYGNLPFSMGKSTISMAIFNSYLSNYHRVYQPYPILSIDYSYIYHTLTIYEPGFNIQIEIEKKSDNFDDLRGLPGPPCH